MTGLTGKLQIAGSGKVCINTATQTPNSAATIQVDSTGTFYVQNRTIPNNITLWGGTLGEGYGQLRLATATVSGTITLAAASSIGGAGTERGTISGNIIGSQALEIKGGGTITLSGANSYSGGTTISAGTLILSGGADRIKSGSDIVVTGTLDMNGQIQTFDSVTGAGTITTGGGALTIGSANASCTFSGVISETGSLTKSGSGMLTLSGVNTYSGVTTISVGILQLSGGANRIKSGNDIIITARLDMNGHAQTFDSVTGTGSITLGAGGTLTIGSGGSNGTFSGVISETGVLIKSGAGTLTLSGANTFTGAATISAGTVVAQNSEAFGTTAGGIWVASVATVDLGGTMTADTLDLGVETITVSGSGVGGNGALVNNGANSQINAVEKLVMAANATIGGVSRWDMRGSGNSLNMAGHNLTKTGGNYVGLIGTAVSNPGSIDVQDGTFNLSLTATLGGTSANKLTVQNGAQLSFYALSVAPAWTLIRNDGATVAATSGTGSAWDGPVTLNGAGTFSVSASCGLTIDGTISGGGSFTKIGTGTLTLHALSSYTGGTVINSGTLVSVANGDTLTSNSSLGSRSPGNTVTIGSGGVLTGSNNNWADNVSAAADGSAAHSYVINAGGMLSNPSGWATGLGSLTLNGGTLEVNNGWSASAPAYVLVGDVAAGGATISRITQPGATYALIRLNATPRIFTVGTGATLSVAAELTVGGLRKEGAGVLKLSGVNTYSGGTTINGGTLQLGVADAVLDTGSVAINSGTAVFDVNSVAQTIGVLSGTGGTLSLGSGALTVNQTANGTLSSVITGTGSLTKTGVGALTLSGANTYTGITTINGGVLSANTVADSTGSSIGLNNTVAGALTFGSTGGTLNFTGASGATTRAITFTGQGVFDINSSSALTIGATGTGTPPATSAWTGNGGIFKSGAGTLTVRNNSTGRAGGFVVNSVTGGTFTMQAGTLNISPEGTTGGAHAVIGDSGGAGVFNQTGGSVMFAPLNASAGNLFYVGIASDGTLNITGGTFTVDGNKAGGMTVGRQADGVLTIGGGTITATVDTPLVNIGFGINASTGILNLQNNGVLLTKTITYNIGTYTGSGTLNFNGGTLRAKAASSTVSPGFNAATITSNGLIVDSNTHDITIAQALSGAGGLTKVSTGTLTLSGNNTYSGVTIVSGGALTLASAGTLNSSGTLNISGAGAVANIDGTWLQNGTNSDTINGGGVVNLSGYASISGSAGAIFVGSTTSGTLNMTGGTFSFSKTGGNGFGIGWSGASGLVNVSGGVMNVAINDVFFVGGSGASAVGTLTVSGTGSVSVGTISLPAAGTGWVNLGTGATGGALQLTGLTGSAAGTLNFNGGTLVAGGSLTIPAAINTVVKSAGAIINTLGNNLTIASALVNGGGGGLTKTGAGILTLSGANTYVGNTIISGGTLALGASDRLDDITAVIVNGSTATFDLGGYSETVGSFALSNGGTLAGSGTLTAATYSLSGGTVNANLGAGSVMVATGTTTLNGTEDGAAVSITSATLTLGGNNRLSDSAAITISGGTLNLNTHTDTIGSLAGSGTVTLGAGGALTSGDGNSTEFSGVISGGGSVTKQGAGTWTLTGNNSYDGLTTVSAGKLLVNNTSGAGLVGSVSVGSSATLGGKGTLSGAVSVGGTLTPGDASAPGTLTVGGLTFASGAHCVMRIDSGASHDMIVSTGAVNLGGATLSLDTAGFAVDNTSGIVWLIHNISGSPISGTFSATTVALPNGEWTITTTAKYSTGASTGGDDVALIPPAGTTYMLQ